MLGLACPPVGHVRSSSRSGRKCCTAVEGESVKRLMHRSKKRLLQHLIGTRDQRGQVRKHCFVSEPAKRGPSLSTDGPPPAQARQAGPQLPSQILRQKYSHLSPRIFGCLCMVLDQMAKHHSAGLED